jgi:hypothetical protein
MQVVDEMERGREVYARDGTAEIFNVLRDSMSLSLFGQVGKNMRPSSDELMKSTRPQITRKQFYSRIGRMKKMGLISKNKGWHLAPLGRVVKDSMDLLHRAHACAWQLKVIDDMGLDMPNDERQEIIKRIVTDEGIRKIVFGI